MNDHLSESIEVACAQSSRGGEIDKGENSPNFGELSLQNFLKQVQEIERQHDKLTNLLKKLQDAHEESKAVTSAADMKVIKRRMEKDLDEVQEIAQFVKFKLELLDRDYLSTMQKPGCGLIISIEHAQTKQIFALMKKLKDTMPDFESQAIMLIKSLLPAES